VRAPGAFVHQAHPARVVFGRSSRLLLGEETQRLGLTRLLLVGAARLTAEAGPHLGARAVGAITEVVMHVPIERARAARALAQEVAADGLVALGGGSAVGLAKAVALELGLPIVAVATTYAGSEMTSVWGLTEDGHKRTGRDERVRPRTVLYDPELTLTLPPEVAGPSALNAVAHAMEALYAPHLDPVVALLAEESVRALATHAPQVVGGAGAWHEAWDGALYGAWLAGTCLDRTTPGLHHALCHVLGGSFGLPHAGVHGVILPHAAAYNRRAAPEAMARLAAALGVPDAPTGLFALARRLGAPASLAALGLAATDLDRAADLTARGAYPNPRPVERAAVRALLQDAFEGKAP
jgi:maleylacetate reductase